MASRAQEMTADKSSTLHRLFEEAWEYDLQDEPIRASVLGDRRWNDRWPEMSPAAYRRRNEHNQAVLDSLHRIDRDSLSRSDQVSYDLFEREYRNRIEEFGYQTWLIPFDQRSGLHTLHELASLLRFETEKDYRDWLSRLRRIPQFVDETLALLREGIRTRIVQPRIIVERVIDQVEKQAGTPPEKSPYFAPFAEPGPSELKNAREALAAEAKAAIASSILPAISRFGSFLKSEYLPAALERPGIWQWSRGEEAYAFLVRKFTTTNMTPLQIHETGKAEVKRIRAQMEAIIAQVGFKGSMRDFFQLLRTDSRFYYPTSEALLDAYRAMAKQIDPKMVKVLRRLPRAPYGVEPVPPATAPHTTAAYYIEPAADGSRAGSFYVNLYKPETRPKYEMMALSLHEAVPGHHLQIALAMELELPQFRRYGGYTAFVEGWALYAEYLGGELGLYDDPYAKFGQLTYEMWRAVRLVVDTGIHAFQWDRQKAIDYFLDNAAKTELDVINEIDRYIGWPGQALAYKIGELKIQELRRLAQSRRGEAFDVREFHERLLENGAVTLDVLESLINDWLKSP